MSNYIHTLLATLGGQPQVVTFTLDLLLQRGYPISEVIVIHPEASQLRLQHSLSCLNSEFVGDQYCFNGQALRCHFRTHVLRLDDEPLADIYDNISATGALDTLNHLICDLKRQQRHIHLSITGGRRLMSLLALSVAFINFDHHDHIWHIYTPEEFKQQAHEGRKMHIPHNHAVSLIESPFVPWSAYFPNLSRPGDGVGDARRIRIEEMDALERVRCEQVVKQAKERQLDVLRAFARNLGPQEVANELGISIKTVDTYKTALLSLCCNVWDKKRNTLDYHFLQLHFAKYFGTDI